MQTLTNRTIAAPVEAEQREKEAILHFTLEGILPAGHMVALHRLSGILVGLTSAGDVPCMLVAQQFTFSELCVLVPLLEAHPHYCPYEVLLAHFTNVSTNVTEEVIEKCRRHLHAALREGVFEHEMRPVRNVISRTRLKLHEFNIDVTSLLETGYLLRPRPKKPRRLRESSSSSKKATRTT
jgi:hypothetical protein